MQIVAQVFLKIVQYNINRRLFVNSACCRLGYIKMPMLKEFA
jgi:hypothetical protein